MKVNNRFKNMYELKTKYILIIINKWVKAIKKAKKL